MIASRLDGALGLLTAVHHREDDPPRPGVEDALWARLDPVYFRRHSAEEIAWHTRLLSYRTESDEPVVKARTASWSEGDEGSGYSGGCCCCAPG